MYTKAFWWPQNDKTTTEITTTVIKRNKVGWGITQATQIGFYSIVYN